jgi:heterodisulfide reductase subunit B
MRVGFFPGCAYKTAAGYEESVNAVNAVLGIELVEIEDWNCCGATAGFSVNASAAVTLGARLMALAQKQGFSEIVTVCNACYATLKKVEHKLDEDHDLLDEVNRRLEPDHLLLPSVVPVRHYLEVLTDDVPADRWPEVRNTPLMAHAKVAAYYGCQFTRPHGQGSQTERPNQLEGLLEKIGVTTVDHSAKTLCCGASHIISHEKSCITLISRITGEMKNKGANLITTICPMCQFNLDFGQGKTAGPKLPVTYFTQVLGLALGVDSQKLGLNKLLIPLDTGWKPSDET